MRPRPGLVTILVPAKNEAPAIGRTLRSLPVGTLRAAGYTVETVVVDGHSSDGTDEIARRHGARVLRDAGSGKGTAMRHARTALHGEFIVMLDADGSYAPDAIPRVVDAMANGGADIVMGDRTPQPGSMSGLHRVGNAMLSMQATILYGRPCRDVCTGLWGFRHEALRSLPLRSTGFELEAELFATSTRMGLNIAHVPVDYLPREGQAKLSARRDGVRIGWTLLRSRFSTLEAPRVTKQEVGA